MLIKTKFSIDAKICTLKYNAQKNGGIIFEENVKLVVPSNQRYFSWEKRHTKDFITNIFTCFWGIDKVSKQTPLFIGAIQLSVKNIDNERFIIDGEQRLTILLLLFKVLKTKYPNLDALKEIHLDWLRIKVNKSFLKKALSFKGLHKKTYNSYLQHAFIIEDIIDSETKVEAGQPQLFDINRFVTYLLSNMYFVVIETPLGFTRNLQTYEKKFTNSYLGFWR